jgi:hypothetical protein
MAAAPAAAAAAAAQHVTVLLVNMVFERQGDKPISIQLTLDNIMGFAEMRSRKSRQCPNNYKYCTSNHYPY